MSAVLDTHVLVWWTSDPTRLTDGIRAALAWRFRRQGDRPSARKLFLFTLLYLPVALGLLAIAWR